jgi:cell division ATPase FtsA
LLMLRCSDEVIVRHGLTKEYLAMVQKAREELTELVKARMSGMMEIVQKNIQKAGARAQAERDGTAPAQPMDSVTVFSDAEGEH